MHDFIDKHLVTSYPNGILECIPFLHTRAIIKDKYRNFSKAVQDIQQSTNFTCEEIEDFCKCIEFLTHHHISFDNFRSVHIIASDLKNHLVQIDLCSDELRIDIDENPDPCDRLVIKYDVRSFNVTKKWSIVKFIQSYFNKNKPRKVDCISKIFPVQKSFSISKYVFSLSPLAISKYVLSSLAYPGKFMTINIYSFMLLMNANNIMTGNVERFIATFICTYIAGFVNICIIDSTFTTIPTIAAMSNLIILSSSVSYIASRLLKNNQ